MELINGIQLPVTQIRIKKNQLLGKRTAFDFKRTLFMSQIVSVTEDNYLVNSNYTACTALILDTNEWVKIKEPFEIVNKLHIDWWKNATEKPPTEATE